LGKKKEGVSLVKCQGTEREKGKSGLYFRAKKDQGEEGSSGGKIRRRQKGWYGGRRGAIEGKA